MNKIVVIAGPTAVGKTKMGIRLAHLLNTDVISGDAYQVYRQMDIGTAKPSFEEQDGITHHLMDIIGPEEPFSVADYQKLVRGKIDELITRGKLPLIVGGSGLYIDSVVYDYGFLAPARDLKANEELSGLGNETLHGMLRQLDPDAASCIHPNNRKRVLRAIELAQSGFMYKENRNAHTMVYDALIFFLDDDRTVLYEQINRRVDEMMNGGLLSEAEMLFHHELSIQAASAIGYHELYAYFRGECSLEEAVDSIKQDSRHYAKRQLTWFRNRNDVIKLMINRKNFDETVNEVYQRIIKFLQEEEK